MGKNIKKIKVIAMQIGVFTSGVMRLTTMGGTGGTIMGPKTEAFLGGGLVAAEEELEADEEEQDIFRYDYVVQYL